VGTERIERKLAAILSADVVGYSRLMAEDETATIRTLQAYWTQIAELVPAHRGRVVDTAGDSVLAEFPTALDAIETGVEIQRVLQTRNAALPEGRRMEFRIGIHLGDVATDGERLYGDGVNIAARLEGLAEPGGICVSGEVHGQVQSKVGVEFQDLGDQQVKNIPRPVRVYRVFPRGTSAARALAAPAARRPWRSVAAAVIVGLIGIGIWLVRHWIVW
jgi:class 3 adenylate cyclase